ncbi:MAG: hypothetical protein M3281_05120, partial [Chloroflexota bacterium]|nr:hypothetical protein [Chloroflexota bacterium]
RQVDATAGEQWPECDEVLANLPFGRRTRHTPTELPELYEAVLGNVAARLRPGGSAVLYTANARLLDSRLAAHSDRLRLTRRLHVDSGGLRCHVWVLASRER